MGQSKAAFDEGLKEGTSSDEEEGMSFDEEELHKSSIYDEEDEKD